MHLFCNLGPIFSWRNVGKLTFSDKGEITLGEYSNYKIYKIGSQEYNNKLKLINRGNSR